MSLASYRPIYLLIFLVWSTRCKYVLMSDCIKLITCKTPLAFWAVSKICCNAESPDFAALTPEAYSKYLPNSSNNKITCSNLPFIPQYSEISISKIFEADKPSSHLISCPLISIYTAFTISNATSSVIRLSLILLTKLSPVSFHPSILAFSSNRAIALIALRLKKVSAVSKALLSFFNPSSGSPYNFKLFCAAFKISECKLKSLIPLITNTKFLSSVNDLICSAASTSILEILDKILLYVSGI